MSKKIETCDYCGKEIHPQDPIYKSDWITNQGETLCWNCAFKEKKITFREWLNEDQENRNVIEAIFNKALAKVKNKKNGGNNE